MIKGLIKKVVKMKNEFLYNNIEIVFPADKAPKYKMVRDARNSLMHREDVLLESEIIKIQENIKTFEDLKYIKKFEKAPTLLIFEGNHLTKNVRMNLIDVYYKNNKKMFKYLVMDY